MVNGDAHIDEPPSSGGQRHGVSGPLIVRAELWYQPIGYRWAHNLADHQAYEIERFVGYFEEMADESAIPIASATVIAD